LRHPSRTPAVTAKGTLAAVVACAVALVAGCGGGGGGKSTAGTAAQKSTSSNGALQSISVRESEYRLTPPNPSVARAGLVEIKLTNRGKIAHSLEIKGPHGEAKLPRALDPGQAGALTVKLDKPGKSEWYCPIDGHRGLGMRGEITVAGGGGSGAAGSSGGGSGASSGGNSSGSRY
jgi:plastocyanin